MRTFGDGFGSLQRSSIHGKTLDFSAVTGSLVFTISGDSVTVSYADTNLSDSLTYSADGLDYAFIGSQGSDQFLVVDDGQLASIERRGEDGAIRFDSTTGVASFWADTIITRGDSSTYSLTAIENFTNAGPSITGCVGLNGLTVAEGDVAVAVHRSSGASDVAVDCAASQVTGPLGGASQEPPIAGRLLANCRDGPHSSC